MSPPVTEKDYLHLQKLDKEYMNKQAEWYDEKHIPYRRFDNLNCFYATMNKDQAKELLENSEIEAVTIDDFL